MANEPQKGIELLQDAKHYGRVDKALAELKKLEDGDELLEQIAALEHEQWIEWSKVVAKDVWPQQRKRWEEYWVPYNQLPESAKDFARKWAQKVLDLLETHRPTRPAKTHGIETMQPAHNHHPDSERISERT